MITFPGGSLVSETTITAITNTTFSFLIKPTASGGGGELIGIPATASNGENASIGYFSSTQMYIQGVAGSRDDPYIWTFPVTANALQHVQIAWNPQGTGTPLVSINGSTITVSLYQTGDGTGSVATAVWTFGAGGANVGQFGAFGYYGSQRTQAAMNISTARRRHHGVFWDDRSGLVHYWPMDDFRAGEYTALSQTVLPDGDVANTFSSGTYANLISDDGSYLVANKSDDAETYICSFGTFTIPAGYSIFVFTSTLNGNTDDTAQAQHGPQLGDGTNLTLATTNWTGSDSNAISIVYSACSQANLDGLKGRLITPTMGKDDELHFDKYDIKVGYREKAMLPWIGTVALRALPSCVLSVGLEGSGWGY